VVQLTIIDFDNLVPVPVHKRWASFRKVWELSGIYSQQLPRFLQVRWVANFFSINDVFLKYWNTSCFLHLLIWLLKLDEIVCINSFVRSFLNMQLDFMYFVYCWRAERHILKWTKIEYCLIWVGLVTECMHCRAILWFISKLW
jgi:hypothetical protein